MAPAPTGDRPRRKIIERRPWPGVHVDDGREADFVLVDCGHGIAIPSEYVDDGTCPCGECWAGTPAQFKVEAPPLATREQIQSACWTAADSLEPPTTDVDLIACLSERNGAVAGAFAVGHGSLESEVMDLAGTCLAWLEQAEARRVEPRRSAA